MERADYRGRVDIWDVVLYTAESLNVLAQGLSFLLGEQMKITFLAMRLVSAYEGADKLMAQISPRGYGVVRKCMSQDLTLGLSTSGK